MLEISRAGGHRSVQKPGKSGKTAPPAMTSLHESAPLSSVAQFELPLKNLPPPPVTVYSFSTCSLQQLRLHMYRSFFSHNRPLNNCFIVTELHSGTPNTTLNG